MKCRTVILFQTPIKFSKQHWHPSAACKMCFHALAYIIGVITKLNQTNYSKHSRSSVGILIQLIHPFLMFLQCFTVTLNSFFMVINLFLVMVNLFFQMFLHFLERLLFLCLTTDLLFNFQPPKGQHRNSPFWSPYISLILVGRICSEIKMSLLLLGVHFC